MIESVEPIWVRRVLILLLALPLALCAAVGGACIGICAALVEFGSDVSDGWRA